MFWLYLFVNVVAFSAIIMELVFVSSGLGMWLYPDLNEILADIGVKKPARILLLIAFTMAFAPAIVLWYVAMLIFVAILLIKLVIGKRI